MRVFFSFSLKLFLGKALATEQMRDSSVQFHPKLKQMEALP